MNTRKRQIQEKIENFMAALAPDQKRFREVSAELQRGEREEIRKDLEGLPLSAAKILVGNLRKSGRLSELKRKSVNEVVSMSRFRTPEALSGIAAELEPKHFGGFDELGMQTNLEKPELHPHGTQKRREAISGYVDKAKESHAQLLDRARTVKDPVAAKRLLAKSNKRFVGMLRAMGRVVGETQGMQEHNNIPENVSKVISEIFDTPERQRNALEQAHQALLRSSKKLDRMVNRGYPTDHPFVRQEESKRTRLSGIVDKLRTRFGRTDEGLNEAKRNPNQILDDIRSTENAIDRTINVNRHIPHVQRLEKLHKEYQKVTGQAPPAGQTNEETLHELYGLAGLYARAIGNKRELSPEEQARGDNPYLTPEGKTTYPTGPLAKIMGAREYVNRASSSLQRTNRQKDQLYDDYLQLAGSVRSGRFKGVTTQDDVDQLLNPRMQQISRILDKNIKRNNRRFKVERENRQALAKLPPLPDPNEPPHYYG